MSEIKSEIKVDTHEARPFYADDAVHPSTIGSARQIFVKNFKIAVGPLHPG